MIRRLFGPLAALAVIGTLAVAAVAYAANTATSTGGAPKSAPAYTMPVAAPSHSHSGNCPNMGGGSPGSSGSSGPSSSGSSSQSSL